MFIRHMVREGGMVRPSDVGDGLAANFRPAMFGAETDETVTVAQLSGGNLFQDVTLTSDVTYTLPTAALIAAAAADMDIGDAMSFVVTNSQVGAFDVVIAVGAGITKQGANNTLSTPPQSSRIYTLIKTAAATFDLY